MDVRKKVLLDLFASPGTLLPVVGGLSLLIASWALGGGPLVKLLGLAGLLAGLGVCATKMILGLEEITNNAYEYVHAQELKKQEEALDKLDSNLQRDRDPRTQKSLRELRQLYSTFAEDVKSGKSARATHEILEIVEDLFRTCVAQLEHSYQLWQTARERSGKAKQRVLQERETVIQEVVDTVQHVARTIEQFRSFATKKDKENLGRLREELDEAMKVARRTEERMASWDQERYTEAELK